MKYRVEVQPSANRRLQRLPRFAREAIERRIDALADDPRPHGVVKLTGRRNAYRIRVGDYRVVYEIHDRVLLVLVIEIDHRREVYRSLAAYGAPYAAGPRETAHRPLCANAPGRQAAPRIASVLSWS